MTTKNVQIRMLFGGGWATDLGPTAHTPPDPTGQLTVPFFVDAENCVYDLDGGPRKIGGTERIYSTALGSPSTIRGLMDYWAFGALGSPSQHRVVHVGADVMADNGDGSFVTVLASADRDVNSIPSYAVNNDQLIIMSDADEAPLKWNNTGDASVLGTNTPKFSFGVNHRNRFFASGNQALPSRLYYSEPLPNGADGDWDAVEAGFIDINPSDGDAITGLVSHKRILWIFKGPNDGSIHTLSGDTPLGGVTVFATALSPVPFTLNLFIQGVGAAGHNSIFRFRDDVGFIDGKTGSVRSLNATDQFGDFREASLSLPINDYLLDRVNTGALKGAWAIDDVSSGASLMTLPVDTSTSNNVILNMDYRFDPPRWSQWPAVSAQCLASVIDPGRANRQTPFIGDTSGFVRRTNAANRSIDETTAINYKLTLPYLDFGNPVAKKTFARGSVGIQPKGAYNGTFGWSRDDNAQQTITFDQSTGDVLAGSADSDDILSCIQNGSDVRFTTDGAHGLVVGDIVALSGTTTYDGIETITAKTSGTFDVTATFVATTTGTVQISSTANFFTLGTSVLGGSRFVDRFFALEEGGEFRSIQFQITQGVLNQDIEVHSLFAELELGADSTEN